MSSLFREEGAAGPLADRVRPGRWEELVGLDGAVGPQTPTGRQIRTDSLVSTILWGPPGSGKTTLARLVEKTTRRPFVAISAVLSALKEVRAVMGEARKTWTDENRPTILFMDEIHRFNRAQQDAFLPFLEEGSVVLLGTTTVNPSFHLTSALLSRCSVLTLPPLGEEELLLILKRALKDDAVMAGSGRSIPEEVLRSICRLAAGDARFALNSLEALILQYPEDRPFEVKSAGKWLTGGRVRYDRGGEDHYNFISAYHKSIRNSDPHAALYWMYRMLEGGEDPLYVARRLVRAASEDVGNAEPNALRRALDAKEAIEFLGMPEGALALAQATLYLSVAPKSNSVYMAEKAVYHDLGEGKRYRVPMALRNAPTGLMREAGYGEGYVYAHDEAEGVADLRCLPRELEKRRYYNPGDSGFEKRISEWMQRWDAGRREAAARRKGKS